MHKKICKKKNWEKKRVKRKQKWKIVVEYREAFEETRLKFHSLALFVRVFTFLWDYVLKKTFNLARRKKVKSS